MAVMHKLLGMFGLGLGLFAALSSSSTLQLNNYSLGTSGSNSGASTSYFIEGSAGELQAVATSSATIAVQSGSLQAQESNVPPAPSLSNNSNAYYNKLSITINNGGNPSDAIFSIALSSDNFSTTNYVQADGTVGATPVFRTYTQWGGPAGQ